MKKNVMNLSSMKVSVRKLALLAVIMVSTLFVVSAGNILPALKNSGIAVSPQGIVRDEMIFDVQYNNANEDKLIIRLTDENGARLYNTVFSGKILNKTFKVETGFETVYLTINNTVTGIEQQFVISTKDTDKVLVTSAH